jgi:hypothetical protein
LYSFIRTNLESTLVIEERLAPSGVQTENGWSALEVEGPLDFALTGILASIAAPLAEAKVSIFAISTYGTDFILVKHDKLALAIDALRKAGHEVTWCN